MLPQSVYPQRAEDVDNLVFACAECNAIKRDYDPSTEGGNKIDVPETSEIPDEVRQRLIGNAEKHIEGKRNSDDWRNEFKTAKRLLDEAIVQYRKCKESAAALLP